MGGRKMNLSEYPDANQSRDERPLGGKKINLSEYPIPSDFKPLKSHY